MGDRALLAIVVFKLANSKFCCVWIGFFRLDIDGLQWIVLVLFGLCFQATMDRVYEFCPILYFYIKRKKKSFFLFFINIIILVRL